VEVEATTPTGLELELPSSATPSRGRTLPPWIIVLAALVALGVGVSLAILLLHQP
jgi:hypothetical protein